MARGLSIFVLSVVSVASAAAQDRARFRVSFDHQALQVSDLDASATFYSGVFGLREIEPAGNPENIRWFSLGNGDELHLIAINEGEQHLTKVTHLGLATDNFEAFVTHLEGMEIPYSDWPGTQGTVGSRADGVKQVYVQDPDGYWIEINDAPGDK